MRESIWGGPIQRVAGKAYRYHHSSQWAWSREHWKLNQASVSDQQSSGFNSHQSGGKSGSWANQTFLCSSGRIAEMDSPGLRCFGESKDSATALCCPIQSTGHFCPQVSSTYLLEGFGVSANIHKITTVSRVVPHYAPKTRPTIQNTSIVRYSRTG